MNSPIEDNALISANALFLSDPIAIVVYDSAAVMRYTAFILLRFFPLAILPLIAAFFLFFFSPNVVLSLVVFSESFPLRDARRHALASVYLGDNYRAINDVIEQVTYRRDSVILSYFSSAIGGRNIYTSAGCTIALTSAKFSS